MVHDPWGYTLPDNLDIKVPTYASLSVEYNKRKTFCTQQLLVNLNPDLLRATWVEGFTHNSYTVMFYIQ